MWSRSGQNLIVSVGTSLLDPYAQTLLDATEVDSLADFLTDALALDVATSSAICFGGEHGHLDFAWSGRRRPLEIAGAPAFNRGGYMMTADELIEHREQPTRVRLSRDQMEQLAHFLRKRPSPKDG